jgi:hypothetical protein
MHLMTAVKTNIVTSIEISGRHAHDSPYFGPLVKTTARNFRIDEISADPAYSSVKNLHIAMSHGATPYHPLQVHRYGRRWG